MDINLMHAFQDKVIALLQKRIWLLDRFIEKWNQLSCDQESKEIIAMYDDELLKNVRILYFMKSICKDK